MAGYSSNASIHNHDTEAGGSEHQSHFRHTVQFQPGPCFLKKQTTETQGLGHALVGKSVATQAEMPEFRTHVKADEVVLLR